MSDLDLWQRYPDAKHVLSLGAGVQSSTLLKMADMGLITPRPVAAVFADTQAEPASVYKWLDWLETQVSIPILRVTQGDLSKKDIQVRRSKKSGNVYRSSMIPAFTMSPPKMMPCSCVGDDEKPEADCATCGGRGTVKKLQPGILPRKCTRDYKIAPIFRAVKKLADIPRVKRTGVYVVQWIGISTDEIIRMKPSRETWAVNRWPLIEMGISRKDCLAQWEKWKMPQPPRSACVFCPYHNDNEWIRLKTEEPKEFKRAVDFEKKMQSAAEKDEVGRGKPFLHSSRQPLDQVEFKPQEKPRNDFNNECEGMCGQ